MRRNHRLAGIAVALLLGTGPIAWAKCNNAHCGNIGEDCEVDIGDVVLAMRASVGLEQLDATQSDAADVAPGEEIDHWNGVRFSRPVGNGTVDIADVVILLRMSVELEMLDGCWGPDVQSVVPGVTCASGATIAEATGAGFCWNGSAAVFVDGQPVETLGCANHGSVSAIRFRVPERSDLPPEGELVDVVVRSSEGPGLLREGLRLMPPCSRNPMPATISPGMGTAEISTQVRLTGSQLGCLAAARLQGQQTGSVVELTRIVVVNDEEVTATVPPLPLAIEEPFDLVVTSGCEERVLPAAWRYWRRNVPSISSLSPTSGAWRGGETVTCRGRRLEDVTAVRVGGVQLERSSGAFSVSSGVLTILSMPRSPTPESETQVAIVPVVAGVTCIGKPYTYGSDNVIRCLDVIETTGPVAGGTLVGIGGDDLRNVEAFLFGSVAASAWVMLDDYRALVVLPPATGPGVVRVGLARGGVVVDECEESFTYE